MNFYKQRSDKETGGNKQAQSRCNERVNPGQRTFRISRFPRIFQNQYRSAPMGHRYAAGAAYSCETGSSFVLPLSFLFHRLSSSRSHLAVSHVRSPCTLADPFCSFISAAHNLPWARIMLPFQSGEATESAILLEESSEQLSATLSQ